MVELFELGVSRIILQLDIRPKEARKAWLNLRYSLPKC
jgi:hypothetical protein